MLLAVCAASCLKSKSNSNQNNPAQVAFINVSPSNPTFNVYLDGTIEGSNLTFPYQGYKVVTPVTDSALSYSSTYAGIHFVGFVNTTVTPTDTFASGNIQFANNTKYSIYLFDTISNYGLGAIQIQDSWDSIPLAVPTSLIRFLNFSTDSAGIDVIYNDTTLWYYNFLFIGNGSASAATLSQYTAFPAGAYLFNFYHNNTEGFIGGYPGSTILDSPTVAPFSSLLYTTKAQKAYTIVASGSADSATSSPSAFKIQVIQMN